MIWHILEDIDIPKYWLKDIIEKYKLNKALLNGESPISALIENDEDMGFNEKQINKLLMNEDADDSDEFALDHDRFKRDLIAANVIHEDVENEINDVVSGKNSIEFKSK